MSVLGSLCSKEGVRIDIPALHEFKVSCSICGKARFIFASDFEKAFTKATMDGYGWTWRWSESKEWAELLCDEHAKA